MGPWSGTYIGRYYIIIILSSYSTTKRFLLQVSCLWDGVALACSVSSGGRASRLVGREQETEHTSRWTTSRRTPRPERTPSRWGTGMRPDDRRCRSSAKLESIENYEYLICTLKIVVQRLTLCFYEKRNQCVLAI